VEIGSEMYRKHDVPRHPPVSTTACLLRSEPYALHADVQSVSSQKLDSIVCSIAVWWPHAVIVLD